MRNKIILTLLLGLIAHTTFAMGAKRPNVPSTPKPPVDNTETKPSSPTISMGPELSPNDFLNSSSVISSSVDIYKKMSELSKTREIINSDQIDQCFDDHHPHDIFSDQISYYTQKMMSDTKSYVGFIGSSYGTSSNDNNYFPTSLIRHPLCKFNSSTIKKIPSSSTISKINEFAKAMNELRTNAINGDVEAKKEILTNWTRFYSCLAYTESLSSADSKTSYNVAAKYSSSTYRKPAGVEFYEDPAQNQSSRLNIGMYQFTPNATGNIYPCIKAWNELHKNKSQCFINEKSSLSDLIKVVGSSLQSFNAFCGIHKMIQTFSIQVNTKNSFATHPDNIINGKFKSEENRCVTPHFYHGKAYVHFGPFENSTGSNLDELMSCYYNSQN